MRLAPKTPANQKDCRMAKRPRYSANLQMPRAAETVIENPIDLVDVPTPVPGALLRMPVDDRATVREIRGHESLAGILGDAVTSLSLAAFAGWHQGVMLQFRLGSYMLDPRLRRPFAN